MLIAKIISDYIIITVYIDDLAIIESDISYIQYIKIELAKRFIIKDFGLI